MSLPEPMQFKILQAVAMTVVKKLETGDQLQMLELWKTLERTLNHQMVGNSIGMNALENADLLKFSRGKLTYPENTMHKASTEFICVQNHLHSVAA